MDQKQLAYFVSVAKYRNFSRAAQDFYLTQPAISHQIKMLEKELDTVLFVRNTKRVTLTDSGELFLEDAKSILDAIEQSKQKLALAKEQPSMLRICHLAAPTHQFLPDVVNQFHVKYPYVKIRLMRKDALQILETASGQNADIYFSMMPDLQQCPGLNIKKIQSDSICLVTRKDHPALQKMILDYDKLASEPFLVFHPEHAKYMNQRIIELCEQLGFHPRITEQFDLYENLLQAVEAGTGISIQPYRSRNYMNTKNLAFTLLDDSNDTLDLAIAWEHEITNPAVPLFLEVFREYMQEHPEYF